MTSPVIHLGILVSGALFVAACSGPAEPKKEGPVALHAGVVEDGRRAFGQCRSCHAIEPGVNRVGPSLHAVVGRAAGSVPDYRYSKAMAASGVVWTDEALEAYLENPRTHVPGTKMSFAGVSDPQRRRDLVAYLKTLS